MGGPRAVQPVTLCTGDNRGGTKPAPAPPTRRPPGAVGPAPAQAVSAGRTSGQRRPAVSADLLPRPTQTRSVPPPRDTFLPPSQTFAAVPLLPLGGVGKPAQEGIWKEVTATLAFILGGTQFCLRG